MGIGLLGLGPSVHNIYTVGLTLRCVGVDCGQDSAGGAQSVVWKEFAWPFKAGLAWLGKFDRHVGLGRVLHVC